MRGDFLKTKALFMTLIIIASIFTVYNIKLVTAEEEVITETNYCCERTTSDLSCIYTTQDQCDASYSSSAVTCEQTSYCKGGCCISEIGKCSKNVPKTVCENTEGYAWYEDAECNLAQCQKNCCNIANSICSYTTSAHCEYIDADYPEVDAEFAEVDDEYSCVDLCTASDKGCCVTEDSCVYDTKDMCETPEIDLEGGTGFYKERLCSDLNLCGCIGHFEMRCVDEDVYWFDSCGNQETVVDSSDRDSDGNTAGINGECDYTKGTWCGYDDEDNAYCKTVNCDEKRDDGDYTWDGSYYYNLGDPGNVDNLGTEKDVNKHDERKMGGERYHGESWCLYESPAGAYLDRPGSQHYRSYCYFGEEIIEPCRDYREEICIQVPYGGDESVVTAAACKDNNIYDSSISTNVSTVPKGNQFWGESETSTTCSEKTLTCDVTFTQQSQTAQNWKCVENCHCLSDMWMVNASKWCSMAGDCGANFNILERESDDGFYLTVTVDELFGAENKKNKVGYDWDCHDEYGQDDYGIFSGSGGLCKGACNEIDETSCVLYLGMDMASWYSGFGEDYGDGTDLDRMAYYIEETPGLNLRNAYGVHGGLLGLSEALENQGEVGMATEWLSDFKYPATVVSFVAGGVGAVFGLIGIIAGTSSAFGPIGLVVAAVAAIVVLIVQFVTSGGKSETVTVTANCESWVPPSGGDFCELCDLPVSQGGLALDDGSGDVLPGYECTEYKCKSLGAACDYISENAGTEREKCFNAHINDVNHPIIEIDEEIFQKYEYTYNLDGTNGVSVTGVQPYTQFHYGIITDELSQCRIDTEPIESFDEMAEMFPDSYYSKNHNQTRVLTPDEEFNYYIRCQDPVGNWNINAFVMKVTTTAGEDVQAPMIESTDIASGSYIAADVSTPVVTIYLNEPTEECRWSYSDQEFDLMENYFIYGTGSIATQSAYYENYRAAVLNVTELGENYFYFACKDLAGNINSQNYAFVLKGTEPLNIDRTSPNGTVYYNDVALQVETSVGAENGKSVCKYGGIEFFTTNDSYHEQLLEDLSTNSYSYDILCQDVAGNQNSTTISFTVDIDTNAPGLGNVYVDEAFNSLVFETDEPATCEYLYEPFAFGEGTATSGTIALTDIQTYYIICEDEFGNQGSFTIEI